MPPAVASTCRRPHDPPEALASTPGDENPLRVRTEIAPPRVFRPNSGLEPGKQIETLNGIQWNEVPVDDVTKGLIDTDTVKEHRQALGCPDLGTCGKAAVIDIHLKWIARVVIDAHALQLESMKSPRFKDLESRIS